jgi:pimeloyl-ACP methyl ester carboxylesterase
MRVARVASRRGFDEVAPVFFTRERVRQIVLSAYGSRPPPEDIVDDYVDNGSVTEAFHVARTFFSPAFMQLPGLYPRILQPALVVVGEGDPHVPLEFSRRPATSMPHASLSVLPGLSHCPHEEDPDAFNPLLLDFLLAHAPPSGRSGRSNGSGSAMHDQ